jgi:hypothetical protein
MGDDVKRLLQKIGFFSLWQNFSTQKVDSITICKSLGDKELTNLGFVTIGDKIRFRNAVRQQDSSSDQQASSLDQQASSLRDGNRDDAGR